jgi:SAM-dependent methyltransferase
MDLRELRAGPGHGSRRHPWERARLRIVSRLLEEERRRPPARIADIGCGDAFVLSEFAHRFPAAQFAAVDPHVDDETAALLHQRFGGRVTLYPTLAEAARAGRADVVLLLDVLEHIDDDVRFLEQLRQSPLVDAATLLLVTVPAYERLFGPHDVFLGHMRRYDPAVLLDRLARAGFRVTRHGQFFFGALVARTLQRWRAPDAHAARPQSGVAGWRGGPLLTRLVTELLWLDFASSSALRKGGVRVPGLSAYALCHPSAS